MTILFATPYLTERGETPCEGGLEAYLLKVTDALKEFGHTSIIVSLGTKEMHYIENGVEIYFVGCQYVRVAKNEIINFLYNWIHQSRIINKKIMEISRQKSIDIIQFASSKGIAACYHGRTPAVLRLSSYAKLHDKELRMSEAAYRARIFCEQFSARRCNAIFGPSKVIADAFAKDIHRVVTVIETPICNDCEFCDESVWRENLSEKKYVLFVGTLSITKGALVMAKCIQHFLRLNSEYYFVCCGRDGFFYGDSIIQILKKAAGKYKDRFIHLGVLPHKELYPIMQHAEFVICPSLIENFSNVCIEAMYFERIVIGTDGGSYEQLIVNGENGLLCIPGDADSLLEKMNAAAAMSEREKAVMGRNARKRVDRLKPEIVVNKLLRYYQYVIDHVHS